MNLKEYNYCKRHHPYALSHLLAIKVNKIDVANRYASDIYAGCLWTSSVKVDATWQINNTSRWISLQYLI